MANPLPAGVDQVELAPDRYLRLERPVGSRGNPARLGPYPLQQPVRGRTAQCRGEQGLQLEVVANPLIVNR